MLHADNATFHLETINVKEKSSPETNAHEKHAMESFEFFEYSHYKGRKCDPTYKNNICYTVIHCTHYSMSKMMHIDEALQKVVSYIKSGDLQQADFICREILKSQPNDIGALRFLGIINYQLHNYDSAAEYIKEVLLNDQNNPTNFYAFYMLGDILLRKGQFDDAIIYYQKSLEINSNFTEAYNGLGICYKNKRLYSNAIPCYKKALDLNPNFIEAYVNLGNVLLDSGQYELSIPHYEKALELDPNLAKAYYGLGGAFTDKKDADKAVTYYRRALQLDPEFTSAYYNLANILREAGQPDEALASLDIAIRSKPDHIKARWAYCFCQLPIIYQDESSIKHFRGRYSNELVKLQDTIPLETHRDIEEASKAVGTHQPFYLAYQGYGDRELQEIYGRLVCKIMMSKYPQWADRPSMPPAFSDEPIRVGIVSGFFYHHSNWKLPIKGWVENLDGHKFSLYGYYTGKKKDRETEVARKCLTRFVEDIDSIEDLCQMIRNDNLHILIYPEIGIDCVVPRLASLRLAPVQCVSWGHPDTTGFPTIDYFLSSDLMEPIKAADHYSERLVRLPNLSIFYEPLDVPIIDANRKSFGLRPDSVLYLCCQSLFKYLPQYDYIYPRIAKQVENGQFLFISYPRSQTLTRQFSLRLNKAFNKFNLSSEDYVIFLPSLDPGHYNAINCLSDIYLDSIGWSGGNTTLEAIACNLPIITCPGEFMRGRHSMAILNMMGVTETTASTIDEYIELAIKLGKDSEWRRYISEKIKNNKHLVYRDRTCITALEDFLERVVNEKLG